MIIRSFAVATFPCPICNAEVTEGIDGIAFLDLRESFPATIKLEKYLQCYKCETIFDLEVSAAKQNAPYVASVSGYPDVKVNFRSMDDEEDQRFDLMPPDDPFMVFLNAYESLYDILGTHEPTQPDTSTIMSTVVVNRLAYASAISAMEAFLSDLLISSALSEDAVLRNLILSAEEFSKTSIPLKEIHANPNVVKDHVRNSLNKVLYYDDKKVRGLYRSAFKIDIFPDEEFKALLFNAVTKRHDIVHRNGKSTLGEPVSPSSDEVRELLDAIKTFASNVHRMVEEAMNTVVFEKLT